MYCCGILKVESATKCDNPIFFNESLIRHVNSYDILTFTFDMITIWIYHFYFEVFKETPDGLQTYEGSS